MNALDRFDYIFHGFVIEPVNAAFAESAEFFIEISPDRLKSPTHKALRQPCGHLVLWSHVHLPVL